MPRGTQTNINKLPTVKCSTKYMKKCFKAITIHGNMTQKITN